MVLLVVRGEDAARQLTGVAIVGGHPPVPQTHPECECGVGSSRS